MVYDVPKADHSGVCMMFLKQTIVGYEVPKTGHSVPKADPWWCVDIFAQSWRAYHNKCMVGWDTAMF